MTGLTDVERRVADALIAEAPEMDATGLADRARRQWRRRRRTRVAAGVMGTVAVVVVVAVIGVVASLIEPDDRPTVVADVGPSRGAPTIPAGWQRVTWRDVELYVPGDWEDGDGQAWCLNHDIPEQGLVERPVPPDTLIFAIGCLPAEPYGVTFSADAPPRQPSGSRWQYVKGGKYLADSWVGLWYDDGRMVQVNAADEETVERILATVRRTP